MTEMLNYFSFVNGSFTKNIFFWAEVFGLLILSAKENYFCIIKTICDTKTVVFLSPKQTTLKAYSSK